MISRSFDLFLSFCRTFFWESPDHLPAKQAIPTIQEPSFSFPLTFDLFYHHNQIPASNCCNAMLITIDSKSVWTRTTPWCATCELSRMWKRLIHPRLSSIYIPVQKLSEEARGLWHHYVILWADIHGIRRNSPRATHTNWGKTKHSFQLNLIIKEPTSSSIFVVVIHTFKKCRKAAVLLNVPGQKSRPMVCNTST